MDMAQAGGMLWPNGIKSLMVRFSNLNRRDMAFLHNLLHNGNGSMHSWKQTRWSVLPVRSSNLVRAFVPDGLPCIPLPPIAHVWWLHQ